jgi:hypothetical protein
VYDDDPGWPNPLRMMIPGAALRGARTGSLDGLVATRMAFLAFSNALVVFAVVVAFAATGDGDGAAVWIVVVALLAVVAAFVVPRFEPPLDCSSEERLASSYRTRFFVRIASGDLIGIVGFVGAFVTGAPWLYYVAGVVALSALWARAAPTRRALEHDQARLRDDGCRISLVSALRNSGREGDGQLAQ